MKPTSPSQPPQTMKATTTTQASSTMKPKTTTQAPLTMKPEAPTEAPSTMKHPKTTQAPSNMKPTATTQILSSTKPTSTCTSQPPSTTKPPNPTRASSAMKPTSTSQAPSTLKHNRVSQNVDSLISETSTSLVIDENSPNPNSWITVEDCSPDDPDAKINLYTENRTNNLRKTQWLTDSEIHSGKVLLKRQFPFVDGLRDRVINGSLVVPANSEFVQIHVINTGSHWVCLSTIGASTYGCVRILDSMYINPHPTAIEHV